MAIIINARVEQKTATYSEWMANDLKLLAGEQAFVVDSNGMVVNFRLGDGTRAFRDLPDMIKYDQGAFVPLLPNGDLPTPSVDVAYTLQFGDELMNVMYWDGSTWSVSDTILLPKGEKGDKGDDGAQGEPGVSVESASIDSNGDLIIELSDTTEINAGNAKGEKGDTGKGLKADGSGINADKPTTVPTPTDGTDSYIWFSTDTAKFYIGTAGTTVWTEIPAVAGANGKTIEKYSNSVSYTVGSQIFWDGKTIYEVLETTNSGETPITNPSKFELVFTGGNVYVERVLKYFLGSENISNLITVDAGSGYINAIIKNDFTILADPDCRLITIDTVDRNVLEINDLKAAATTPSLWMAACGNTPDNTNVKLIDFVSVSETTGRNFLLDVEDYDSVTLCYTYNFSPFTTVPTVRAWKQEGIAPEEDAVKKYIDDKTSSFPIGNKSILYINKPDYLPTIRMYGTFPIDENATENILFEWWDANKLLYKINTTVKWQGSSTLLHPKKNLNIRFYNDEGGNLKLKIGDWFPDRNIHFKAYFNDRTFTRDVSGNQLMRKINDNAPFPHILKTDLDNILLDNNKNHLMAYDANYQLDGFPLELYFNDEFYGVMVARQRRENENYAVNDALKTNIYLANSNLDAIRLGSSFNPAQWELKSPKISGYEEHGVIDDAEVMGYINRLWSWFSGIKTGGGVDFSTTYQDYIDIDNWARTIIGLQLLGIWDYYANNLNLISKNGNIWRLFAHDLDWSVGLHNYYTTKPTEAEVKQLTWGGYYVNDYYFRDTLYPKLLPKIQEVYAQLRNDKVFNLTDIYELYRVIPANIGYDLFKKELDKWGAISPQTVVADKGTQNIQWIMQFFKWKIDYLDSIWLTS